jgi:hypothetical protein
MRVDHKRRWLAVGAVFSAGAAGVTFSVLTNFAGAGIASANAKPVNTQPLGLGDSAGGKDAQGVIG